MTVCEFGGVNRSNNCAIDPICELRRNAMEIRFAQIHVPSALGACTGKFPCTEKGMTNLRGNGRAASTTLGIEWSPHVTTSRGCRGRCTVKSAQIPGTGMWKKLGPPGLWRQCPTQG